MPTRKAPIKKAPAKKKSAGKASDDASVNEILEKIMADIGFDSHETLSDSSNTPSLDKSSKFKAPSQLLLMVKLPTWLVPKFKLWAGLLPKLNRPTHLFPKFKVLFQALPKIDFPFRSMPNFKFPTKKVRNDQKPTATKQSLPLVIVAAALAIVIAGFWGPQIVRALGIPIDPKPFTAIYFQDPKIVETGIVAGDLVVFGVHNGFREGRNLTWRMESGSAPLTRGQISVNANEDSQLAVSTTGAIPGELLKIYIEGTTAPITIQVVG